MDYFYDGQIRRYVTQFMRVFIGFKYKTGGDVPEERHVPVLYGDMTRMVASIIKENSENKMNTVPRIACYIGGLEMDTTRLSDPTFVSKVNIRQRAYTKDAETGAVEYQNYQGGNYTVERLMPTPFKLSMKADIWTSNTDQKLQLLEQLLVLFNPSLEVQTTDNYIDWTSLSVINLSSLTFTSRTIPQGGESEIDVCSVEFDMPIYISPPAKVKKLGVVRSIIANMFNDDGSIKTLDDLIYNVENTGATTGSGNSSGTSTVNIPLLASQRKNNLTGKYGVYLFKSDNGQSNDYDVTLILPTKEDFPTNWRKMLENSGGFIDGISKVFFMQPTGYEMGGTFILNPMDESKLIVTLEDIPSNTIIDGASYVDAIIDPYKFNPVEVYGGQANFPALRYLMLDDVNPSTNVGQSYGHPSDDSVATLYDGPDAWKDLNGNDPVIKANSIIKWDTVLKKWITIFDPVTTTTTYITNARTNIQYRWDGEQWLKSFEGEYAPGYWRLQLDG
jgi:hypothetical protein